MRMCVNVGELEYGHRNIVLHLELRELIVRGTSVLEKPRDGLMV